MTTRPETIGDLTIGDLKGQILAGSRSARSVLDEFREAVARRNRKGPPGGIRDR